MKLKRLLAAALALCLAVSLAACSDTPEETVSTTPPTAETTTQPIVTQPAVAEGYKVTVVDEGGNPVSGAFVQLCLDTCFPGITDESGVASFQVEEADYKVSFVNLPEGYTYSSDVQEFYFDDGEKELTIVLKAVA